MELDILNLQIRIIPFHGFNRVAILLINFIAIILIYVVYRNNRFTERKDKVFLGMAVSLLTWVNFAYLARIFGLYNSFSEFLIKIAWFATPFLFYFTFIISSAIAGVQNTYRKLSNTVFIVVLTSSLLAGLTNLIIEGISINQSTGYFDIIYGPLFFIFLFVIFSIIVLTFLPLINAKLNQGSKLFLIGLVVFYILNIIFNIALPVFFNVTHLYFLGDYSTIFLLGFTTFAIVKHNLFDIKVIATEVLTFLVWGILLSNLLVAQDFNEFGVDLILFIIMIVFGILLVRSVSNEVKQREKLQELTDKLQALDKQKDEFINMAAHELRAPMTAIKGYISMIMEGDAGEIPDKVRDYLTDVTSVNDRLVRLVNNMLNVSRIEEGRLVYKTEAVRLSDIAKNVFVAFKFEAQRKGLAFEFNVPNDINDTVMVDADRLNEIIGNFVSNAVKYTEKGSIAINLSQPTPRMVRLGVKDTGPGISKSEQEKLFQKFYRVQSTAGKTIGTGLGLYISKLLVEKFNGTMGLVSDADTGSEFWFEIPVTDLKLGTVAEDNLKEPIA